MSITESEVETVIDLQLGDHGWKINPKEADRNVYKQQARTKEQKRLLAPNRPDYVLYAFDDSDNPTVVIEAKKPNKSLSVAIEEGINKYARKLGVPIVVATDGWRVKTWHVARNEPLFLNGREVDELFSPAVARHFVNDNHFNTFSKDVTLTQEDLIRKFKKANDILKSEGLSAGIERFSEFANLMFLKLHTEDGGSLAGISWAELEAKRGKQKLRAVQSMLQDLRRTHCNLFERTTIANAKNMERLIEILSSFRLSSVQADIKGVAFEHFIHSYTRGTKNDLGQYFTPRHIVRMMVHFLQPNYGETIYDPFCGTGGMLIECFRFLIQRAENSQKRRFIQQKSLFGRDNSSVARIAMMNMIMFGDGHSNIQQGDSYARLGETKNKYDIVITNIPFSQQTDFCEGYPVVPSGEKNGDSIGVQHCLESLKNSNSAKNPRAAIIVPIGFLYKKELSAEREHIFKNWNLDRVVELSPKCFQPYTEQQTAVLFVSRPSKSPNAKTYCYYRVRNDGYSQDGYRVPLPGENDIDRAMDYIGGSKVKIDLNDKSARFKKIVFHKKAGYVRLSEIADVVSGAGNISPKTKIVDVHNGIHPIMMVADLAKKHIDYCLTESTYKLTDVAVAEKKPHKFVKNTILIPTTGKASLKNHRALLGINAFATSTLTGVTAKEGHIHPFCLWHFFQNFDVEDITYDLGYPGITSDTLGNILIPVYSKEKSERIIKLVADTINLSKKLTEKHEAIISA